MVLTHVFETVYSFKFFALPIKTLLSINSLLSFCALTANPVFELLSIVQTHWIDVCPTDTNLLASGGQDKQIKIYDRRTSKIVKKFDGMYTGEICLNDLNKIY